MAAAHPFIACEPYPLSGRRIAAVLNPASGGVDPSCEALTREILAEAGAAGVTVTCADPQSIAQALERAAAEAEVLVVLGGDGTLRAAAERCGAEGPALLPLPGGTMNVLARALYGPRPWPEVLRAVLPQPGIANLSGGRAGGRLFLISALIGVPSRWVRAREALRRGRLVEASAWVREAVSRPLPEPVSYDFGRGERGTARALAIRCPLTSRALAAEAQVLEAAAIDPSSAAEAASLGMKALFGRWREHPAVAVAETTAITVERTGGAPALLDGEEERLKTPLRITFKPKAVRVLLPPGPLGG